MLKELLTQLWANAYNVGHSPICLTASVHLNKDEERIIRNSAFLWCAIFSEKASAILDESSFRAFGGRICKYQTAILTDSRGFASFLELLDEFDETVQRTISSDESAFKGHALLTDLDRLLSKRSPDLWRLSSPVFTRLLSSNLQWETVAFFRQLGNLLSKIRVDRSDLLCGHISEFYNSEEAVSRESLSQTYENRQYWHLILAMRDVLAPVIDSFSIDPRLCQHGPGAVANTGVKSRVHKYLNMGYDARISYLLEKEGYGDQAGFAPLTLVHGDRTSRLIFVPKSWKKLRGISAEPVELQYFQQAVYQSLAVAMRKTYLGSVIDLQNQDKSRTMARKGSCDGSLATIDLTSASDMVSLQLIKDVFGNSNLCRWLLATRSTHTLVNNERVRINKFAPMGSTCCFPIECLIFAAISLASVSGSYGIPNLSEFQVFGDDIICPTRHAETIIRNLQLCGFIVNNSKTYISGDYRESCGMDAWCGYDVTPLKVKEFSIDFNGVVPLSYKNHSRTISYMNGLLSRGYKNVRSFLLERFLRLPITLNKEAKHAKESVLFGLGASGSIAALANQTNYQVKRVPLKGLFRSGFRMIIWKPRYRRLTPEDEQILDEVNYFEWLLRFSTDQCPPVVYDLEYFRGVGLESTPTETLGMQMVPMYSDRDTWYDYLYT